MSAVVERPAIRIEPGVRDEITEHCQRFRHQIHDHGYEIGGVLLGDGLTITHATGPGPNFTPERGRIHLTLEHVLGAEEARILGPHIRGTWHSHPCEHYVDWEASDGDYARWAGLLDRDRDTVVGVIVVPGSIGFDWRSPRLFGWVTSGAGCERAGELHTW